MNNIHVGDVGTAFLVTIKDENSNIVDISTATTKQFYFKKPDGTTVTKSASLFTDGTDGKMVYYTISNDLNISGKWTLQAHIVTTTTDFKTDVYNFIVDKNIV